MQIFEEEKNTGEIAAHQRPHAHMHTSKDWKREREKGENRPMNIQTTDKWIEHGKVC